MSSDGRNRWPATLLPAVVVASWRGGVHFIACAVAYAAIAYGHLDWIAVISGPLTLVGVLFLELRSIADVPAPA
jgi:hypothetical protein